MQVPRHHTLLQWRRQPPHVEVSVTLGMAYMSFFIANAYLKASGVIAVVVFGLTGADLIGDCLASLGCFSDALIPWVKQVPSSCHLTT